MRAAEPSLRTLPIGSAVAAITEPEVQLTDALPKQLRAKHYSAARQLRASPAVREMHPDVEAIPPGTVLAGRYRIVRKVAEGGMGIIYKAIDEVRKSLGTDDGQVALKFTKPLDDCAEESARSLMIEHARVMALSHSNIVQVYNFERHGPHCFFVMEWLSGEPLRTCGASLPSRHEADKRHLIEQIAAALAAAHEQGVVHADVQPANIVVTADGGVKLVDFGNIRRTLLHLGEPRDEYRATPRYASPDVLAGAAPAARDDVFAFGVVAYELLSGTRPFGEHTARRAEKLGLKAAPLEHVESGLAGAVMRCLAFDCADRFSNAGDFLQALTIVSPQVSMPAERQLRPAHRSSGLPMMAAAAALIALCAAFIGSRQDGSQAELSTPLVSVAAPVPAMPTDVEPLAEQVQPPPAIDERLLNAIAIADVAELTALDMRDEAVAVLDVDFAAEATSPIVAAEAVVVKSMPEEAVTPVAEALPTAAAVGATEPDSQEQNKPADVPRLAVKQTKNVWLQHVRSKTPVGMSALDVTHYEAPVYPRQARKDSVAGAVDMSFAVAPNGQPVGIDILHAEPLNIFNDAALAAVREWRFHPVDGGKFVKVRLRFLPSEG